MKSIMDYVSEFVKSQYPDQLTFIPMQINDIIYKVCKNYYKLYVDITLVFDGSWIYNLTNYIDFKLNTIEFVSDSECLDVISRTVKHILEYEINFQYTHSWKYRSIEITGNW